MTIPSDNDILAMLDELEHKTADDLESQWVEFKPWSDPKSEMRLAVEYAACFANAEGGVLIFGVADRTRGRAAAIRGAKGYDLDVWRRGIFDATRPNLSVELSELTVPEGTGKLLVIRVPKGESPPYGTAQGLYQRRVGKNCMPMDPQSFQKARITAGAMDWSGVEADGVERDALDPVEIARARNILRRLHSESELLALDDELFLQALGAVRGGKVTHAGLLLFGREQDLRATFPQHQAHYVYIAGETKVQRNDSFHGSLLQILEHLEQTFTGPINPEQEVSAGLFKMRIPAFPVEVVREAFLNAVTHRDYTDPGEVLIRHMAKELVVTSPGGFVSDITPRNILRHEPVARNRSLAEAFEKLRLVERAGIGRRRIFMPLLSYGKRAPLYETDGERVTLHIFDGAFDEKMALLLGRWRKEERDVDLDSLLILSFLRENAYLTAEQASGILQLGTEESRAVLDRLSQPKSGILERLGRTRAATYHLNKAVARELIGKAGYTRVKGVDPIQFPVMVRNYVEQHGSISNAECRELLMLGESPSASVEVSRYLREWSGETGFLEKRGTRGRGVHYILRASGSSIE